MDLPSAARARSPRAVRVGLPAAGLVLMTLAAYLPLWQAGFVWDDDALVTANPHLRSLAGLGRAWLAPPARQYYPLVHTVFWGEYHLWGLNPLGYHVVNVLLHGVNALLLWRVLRRLSVPGAWWAAALFAVHPVCVESVAWVAELKNLLSTACYLGGALALLRFWPPEEDRPRPAGRWRYYALALLLFAAALLSKTVTCSLPAAFLLVRWWKRGRVSGRDVLVSAPLFALGLALALQTIVLEQAQVGARGADWDLSPVQRVLVAGRALWFYAGKLAWPAPLAFIYPRWDVRADSAWQYAFPLAALVVLVALVVFRRRLGRGPLTAALFFAGTLVPALGFFNVYPMRFSFVADHFQYLAAVGLLALAGAGMGLALAGLRPPARWAGGAAGVLLVALLGALTWQRARAYHDELTLWDDTLAKNPDCWMAYTNRGNAYLQAGRLDEALRDCTRAVALKPDLPEAYGTRGEVYLRLGQLEPALRDSSRAVELRPGWADAYNNRGNVHARLQQPAEALADYTRALERNADFPAAYVNRGNVYLMLGRVREALGDYGRAIAQDPELAEAYDNRGTAYLALGRFELAGRDYARALELRPGSPKVYFARAVLRYAQKDFAAAWDDVKRGEELGGTPNPKFVSALEEASARLSGESPARN